MWESKEVSITEIEVDLSLQMRSTEPPPEEYEELLRKQRGEWPFPPLRCIQCGERLLLVEGFTRLRAAASASRKRVPVEVRPGDWKEAVAEACASNNDHGFRRTTADKRRAVMRAKEDISPSPTVIAKACKVSRAFVYATLDELKPEQPTKKSKKKGDEGPNRAPAQARNESEIDDECPVCGNHDWTASDAGYTCSTCQHEHGEASGVEDDEKEERASRRELIEEGVARDLAEVNSAYGRLFRAVKRAGLDAKTERPMLQIHKVIQEAIRAQRKQ